MNITKTKDVILKQLSSVGFINLGVNCTKVDEDDSEFILQFLHEHPDTILIVMNYLGYYGFMKKVNFSNSKEIQAYLSPGLADSKEDIFRKPHVSTVSEVLINKKSIPVSPDNETNLLIKNPYLMSMYKQYHGSDAKNSYDRASMCLKKKTLSLNEYINFASDIDTLMEAQAQTAQLSITCIDPAKLPYQTDWAISQDINYLQWSANYVFGLSMKANGTLELGTYRSTIYMSFINQMKAPKKGSSLFRKQSKRGSDLEVDSFRNYMSEASSECSGTSPQGFLNMLR